MLKRIWNHKWFPRVFYTKPDGGKDSRVTAYFLIEWKPVFSIGLLKFSNGSRKKYHSHAFNGLTWWLCGEIMEERLYDVGNIGVKQTMFYPSLKPKFTPRDNIHRNYSYGTTWALTFRGRGKTHGSNLTLMRVSPP